MLVLHIVTNILNYRIDYNNKYLKKDQKVKKKDK